MRLLGRALHAEPFLVWPIALLIAMFTPMQQQGARARALSSGAGGPFRRAGVATAADGNGSGQAQRHPAARSRSPRQAALLARSRQLASSSQPAMSDRPNSMADFLLAMLTTEQLQTEVWLRIPLDALLASFHDARGERREPVFTS